MSQSNKIMIVDDNLIDRMITIHLLKKNLANRELLVMESADLALDYLAQNKTNPIAMPSLILLDLDMPGVNGFEFIAQFKKITEELKNTCRIIVLTGSDVQADLEQIAAEPLVWKVMTKPLVKDDLISETLEFIQF